MTAMQRLFRASLRQTSGVSASSSAVLAQILRTTTRIYQFETHPQPQTQPQQIRHASSSSAIGEIKFDQTKESNDPSKPVKSEHKAQAQKTTTTSGEEAADPQPSPSKSTGIETEGGPGSAKAGQGKEPKTPKNPDILKTIGRPK